MREGGGRSTRFKGFLTQQSREPWGDSVQLPHLLSSRPSSPELKHISRARADGMPTLADWVEVFRKSIPTFKSHALTDVHVAPELREVRPERISDRRARLYPELLHNSFTQTLLTAYPYGLPAAKLNCSLGPARVPTVAWLAFMGFELTARLAAQCPTTANLWHCHVPIVPMMLMRRLTAHIPCACCQEST